MSNAFFNAELESELGEKSLKQVTSFKSDSEKNEVMSKLETDRVAKPYAHVQSPSCENKGPVFFTQAFCKRHCELARSKGIPTDLSKYIQHTKIS